MEHDDPNPVDRLARHDPKSRDLVDCLRSIFSSPKDVKHIFHLEGPEALRFINIIDQLMDSPHIDERLRAKCLRALRKVSGRSGELPSSHIITGQLSMSEELPVAAGGFADVWKGMYGRAQVAIKVFRIYRTDDMAKVKKRFCKEAVIWKWLRHPNILPFLGVSYDVSSQLALVSEWMPYGSIVQYLKSHPEANRLKSLLDVSKGLEFLHAHLIVHGDLKGENILINNNLDACLADFGLASFVCNIYSITVSVTQNSAGTTRWMAPELFNTDLSDPRVADGWLSEASDIYAFGMVALEVFTGNVPFYQFRPEAVTIKVLAGDRPDRPENTTPIGLSNEVWAMIELCWQQNQDERPKIETVLACFDRAVKSFSPAENEHSSSAPSAAADDDDAQSEIFSLYSSDHQTLGMNPADNTSPLAESLTINWLNGINGFHAGEKGHPNGVDTDRQEHWHGLSVTLAVVGASVSDNDSLICIGCEKYNISKPVLSSVTGTNDEIFRYTTSTGTIDLDSRGLATLFVIGVNVTELALSANSDVVWPEYAPRIDGAIVCYDPSNVQSFTHVEKLTRGYRSMMLPTAVAACHTYMYKMVDPQITSKLLRKYDVDLLEINSTDAARLCIHRMIESVICKWSSTVDRQDSGYPNAVSPDISPYIDPEISNVDLKPNRLPFQFVDDGVARTNPSPSDSTAFVSSTTSSKDTGFQNRARSASDPLSTNERNKDKTLRRVTHFRSTTDIKKLTLYPYIDGDNVQFVDYNADERILAHWVTLEELMDKLVMGVVDGVDGNYVDNFMLTYRRFTNPRSVLLAIRKKMLQLNSHSSMLPFAAFAQTRLCQLLSDWIREFPHDFAFRGSVRDLSVLVNSVMAIHHLVHYGRELRKFLKIIPHLVDEDTAWTMGSDNDDDDESGDSFIILEEDEDLSSVSSVSSSLWESSSRQLTPTCLQKPVSLSAKAFVMASSMSYQSLPNDLAPSQPRSILKKLIKLSRELNDLNPRDVAQEITRIDRKLFIEIKPRHWLKHTLGSTAKDLETDTVARFTHVSNHIAEWVSSLILCHDRPKDRAKQIEKFIEIGAELRPLNNYSALHALVSGIHSATCVDETSMKIISTKNPLAWSLYASWDKLFAVWHHQPYRMALRTSRGPCIPAMEVHILDFKSAHEGNPDFSTREPLKMIHWSKFKNLSELVSYMKQLQEQCRASGVYHFKERPQIRDMIFEECLMDVEMKRTRAGISGPTDGEVGGNSLQNTTRKATPAILRRMLFL